MRRPSPRQRINGSSWSRREGLSRTSVERGATRSLLPGRGYRRRVCASSGSLVSTTVCQALPYVSSGSVNVICRWPALNSSRNESSTIASAERVAFRDAVPVEVDSHVSRSACPVVARSSASPSRRSQAMSALLDPWMGRPEEPPPPEDRMGGAQRGEPGGEHREHVVVAGFVPVDPADARCPGSRRCCCRCWVRPSSSPCAIIGTPCDSSSVVRKLRFCRSRRASMSGSSVGPSTPWFQDRLWLSPSRLSSPLASLCLSL